MSVTGTRPTLQHMRTQAVLVQRTASYKINKGLVEGPSVWRVWAKADEGAKGSRKRVSTLGIKTSVGSRGCGLRMAKEALPAISGRQVLLLPPPSPGHSSFQWPHHLQLQRGLSVPPPAT